MLLQILIALAHVAQVDIILPAITHTRADRIGHALKRRHRGGSPHADKADLAPIRHARIGRRAHLHRERDGLRQQDRDEEQRILESGEEFHEPEPLEQLHRLPARPGTVALVD